MTLLTTGIGIFYAYAVIKTGSIWPAVILHGATNSITPLLMAYFGDTPSWVFAFGIGIYGTAFLALFAIWLLIAIKQEFGTHPESFEQDNTFERYA